MPKATVLKEFNKYVPGESIEIPNELVGENQIPELTASGHIQTEPSKAEAKQAEEKAKLEAKQAEELATLQKKQAEEAAKLEEKQAKEEEKEDEGVKAVFEEEETKKNRK